MFLTRRATFGAAAAFTAVASIPSLALGAGEPDAPAKTTLTPDQALSLLKRGNADYLSEGPAQAAIGRRRRLELARGQAPFAAYVSCSDSRVPPETLFGRGLGELFIVRNAGNTVDTAAMGSLEFAVAQLGVPLIVVMGHERCGAVAAALSVVKDNAQFPGSIGRMVEPIVPAALAARGQPGDELDNAARANVRRTVHRLRTASEPMLLDPQRSGKLKVVGAVYDLDTGVVDFFDEAPTPT